MTDLDCVIGLGANLGEPRRSFGRALGACRTLGQVVATSDLFDTEPVGPPQPRYLNAALRLVSSLDPESLLAALQHIEEEEGRRREVHWGPRTLDLDVLWMRNQVWNSPRLTVPHPRLRERAFALVPLLQVAPDARDPQTQELYSALVAGLDTSGIRPLRERFPG